MGWGPFNSTSEPCSITWRSIEFLPIRAALTPPGTLRKLHHPRKVNTSNDCISLAHRTCSIFPTTALHFALCRSNLSRGSISSRSLFNFHPSPYLSFASLHLYLIPSDFVRSFVRPFFLSFFLEGRKEGTFRWNYPRISNAREIVKTRHGQSR